MKLIHEAIASSSAHGISRAAATKARSVRVMWILLFIVFLAIFLKSGISLVLKLGDSKLTKIYHLDQAPFVFPDLYFCPSNPYSGSYPFVLTKEEADLLNNEVARLIARYKTVFGDLKRISANALALYVQKSFPFHLLARHMLLRQEQSVLLATLTKDLGWSVFLHRLEVRTFYNYENLLCFQPILTDYLKEIMMDPRNDIELRLLTDPYLTGLNFSGYTIQPITGDSNSSFQFLDWNPRRTIDSLKASGFKMLIVPPGAYPSPISEKTYHMAPGNEYAVKLKMTENTCTKDLYETHCTNNHPPVDFMNPLTGKRESFNYSNTACLFTEAFPGLVEKLGCQLSSQPSLWKLRDYPHCYNVSELTAAVIKKRNKVLFTKDPLKIRLDATEQCKTRIPCTYQTYSASFSFDKWPSIGSGIVKYFANYFSENPYIPEYYFPSLARVSRIAKQIDDGDHSSHLEGVFRSYVSDSMLSVRISIQSPVSPQIVLSWSYTLMDFLADTGGLLGLYIGCSLLTLCELLELIYIIISVLLKRRSESKSTAGGADETGGGAAGEIEVPEDEALDARINSAPGVSKETV